MKKPLFITLLLFSTAQLFSQFTLTGELRPKSELRDGYKTLSTHDQRAAIVTAQRSRLNFNYADSRFSTRFAVQDVRIWGESPSKADVSSLNVFEAWAEVFIKEGVSLRLGRQELSYDQNRLLGASNWNDVGASHDLMQFIYKRNFDFRAGFAYNNDKSKNSESNYPVNFYKTMAFVRAEKDLGAFLNASMIFLADGNQKEASDDTVYQRLTYGGNLFFRNDSVKTKIYGTFYLQSGKSPDGMAINAYFLSLNLDYSFTKKLTGILAMDYFSGDNAFSSGNTKHSFNNLFGNTHSYYGYMDYFGQIDKDTKGGGLMDIYARLNSKLSKKTSSELTFHYFALTNHLIDSVSHAGQQLKADPFLGTEIDLVVKHKPAANLEFSFGYSAMLAGPTMEILKGGSHSKYQQWAWAMITFKPEFIKANKNN